MAVVNVPVRTLKFWSNFLSTDNTSTERFERICCVIDFIVNACEAPIISKYFFSANFEKGKISLMGCQHSVPQVASSHKIAPITKYSPARAAAAEFKFKRSRSGSIDTDISSRLESRDSARLKPGLTGPGGSGDHVVLDSLDELDDQCSKFTRNKPIMISAALKKKLIQEQIKKEVLPDSESADTLKTTVDAAYVPVLSVVEDISSSGDFSIDLIKMLDVIDVPEHCHPVESVPEIGPEYVHVDPGVTISCFVVQPDSWYTAPRPYIRVQIIEFKWK